MDASYIDDFDIEAVEFFELCEQLRITYCSLNATFAEDLYTATRSSNIMHLPAILRRSTTSRAI